MVKEWSPLVNHPTEAQPKEEAGFSTRAARSGWSVDVVVLFSHAPKVWKHGMKKKQPQRGWEMIMNDNNWYRLNI